MIWKVILGLWQDKLDSSFSKVYPKTPLLYSCNLLLLPTHLWDEEQIFFFFYFCTNIAYFQNCYNIVFFLFSLLLIIFSSLGSQSHSPYFPCFSDFWPFLLLFSELSIISSDFPCSMIPESEQNLSTEKFIVPTSCRLLSSLHCVFAFSVITQQCWLIVSSQTSDPFLENWYLTNQGT